MPRAYYIGGNAAPRGLPSLTARPPSPLALPPPSPCPPPDTVKVRLQTQPMANPIYSERLSGPPWHAGAWMLLLPESGCSRAAAHPLSCPCRSSTMTPVPPAGAPPSPRRRHRLLQKDAAVGGRARPLQGRDLAAGGPGAPPAPQAARPRLPAWRRVACARAGINRRGALPLPAPPGASADRHTCAHAPSRLAQVSFRATPFPASAPCPLLSNCTRPVLPPARPTANQRRCSSAPRSSPRSAPPSAGWPPTPTAPRAR